MQEFEVDYTKKYAQLILRFFWVVYMDTVPSSKSSRTVSRLCNGIQLEKRPNTNILIFTWHSIIYRTLLMRYKNKLNCEQFFKYCSITKLHTLNVYNRYYSIYISSKNEFSVTAGDYLYVPTSESSVIDLGLVVLFCQHQMWKETST